MKRFLKLLMVATLASPSLASEPSQTSTPGRYVLVTNTGEGMMTLVDTVTGCLRDVIRLNGGADKDGWRDLSLKFSEPVCPGGENEAKLKVPAK